MSGTFPPVTLRLADPSDVPQITKLIELSVGILQSQDYSQQQRDGALGTVFGVDTQLIADGTYYLAVLRVDGANATHFSAAIMVRTAPPSCWTRPRKRPRSARFSYTRIGRGGASAH